MEPNPLILDNGVAPRIEPSWRFLRAHPAHLVALGFGTGLGRPAPGTWGTLGAWLSYVVLSEWISTRGWLLLLSIGFVVGIWACQRTGRSLGRPDHGAMVWDEIIAFWLVLVFVPNDLPTQAFAFLIFRLFDIFKPTPIRDWEKRFKNGFGVMLDDLIAAFYTLLVFALWRAVFG